MILNAHQHRILQHLAEGGSHTDGPYKPDNSMKHLAAAKRKNNCRTTAQLMYEFGIWMQQLAMGGRV